VSLADFDRVPLTFGPSPVHPLRRLTSELGGAVDVWMKREPGSRVLYAHLGGRPAVNGYAGAF
jgi:1-aminocyclopropane-1-carboxylate deaminase/D-cysteine desulfhydrase-like pyridoxal-dependent ACC family enzyme